MHYYDGVWSREYAAEAINRYEKQFRERADYNFATWVVTSAQGAALAEQAGIACCDMKTVDIAHTVADIIAGTKNKYVTITRRQAHALGVALLERYSTARGIGAAIWGLSEAEIEGAGI